MYPGRRARMSWLIDGCSFASAERSRTVAMVNRTSRRMWRA
jgi:hypothetical protein